VFIEHKSGKINQRNPYIDMLDKHGILPRISDLEEVNLELGCGQTKKKPSFIGIDQLNYPEVDLVGDVFDILDNFPEQTVDRVYSSHFFEHVHDISRLMDRLSILIKPNGSLEIVVPHFSNPYFYSDYTHKVFFGLYSFSYLASDNILKRKVPTYNRQNSFELVQADLKFQSPFFARHRIKKYLGKLININRYTKEFYEENLCYLFPCYEIKYTLRKKTNK
jgi:SAM-dependent methyltransferase